MPRFRQLSVFVYLSLPLPVCAAGFDMFVKDARGAPIPDAVVTAVPRAGLTQSAPPPTTHVIDQKDETFIPYIEVFRPGDEVVFQSEGGICTKLLAARLGAQFPG